MQKSKIVTILVIVIVIVVLVAVVFYLLGNKKEVLNPTSEVSENIVETNNSLDKTVDWKTYSNTTYNYSIKYPNNKNWVYEEISSGVGFGTKQSKEGGYIWGVSVWGEGIKDRNITDVEKIIALEGNQFSDRKESREKITINGVPALLVNIDTNQVPDWALKNVYLEKEGKVYVISNGGIDNPDFKEFYNSFRFSK